MKSYFKYSISFITISLMYSIIFNNIRDIISHCSNIAKVDY